MDIFLGSPQNWPIFRGHFYAYILGYFLRGNVHNGGYFLGVLKFQISFWGA